MASTPDSAGRGWVQIDGSTLGVDTSAAPGFHSDGSGIQVGADVTVAAHTRIGAAFGYSSSWLHDSYGSSGNQSLYRGSLYGYQGLGPIALSAVVSYAHTSNDTRRYTGAGDADASRGTNEVTGAVQAAVPFDLGGATVTPAAGVLISRLGSSAFTETDGVSAAFAVTGVGMATTFVTPYALASVSKAFTDGKGLTIAPEAEIGYRHDEAAQGGAFTLTAADGTVFTGNRVGLAKGAAIFGVGITAGRDRWTAYIKYRGEAASQWSDQSAVVGVRMAF
jgi:uncharacterized protein with beta-barrel porin domain